MSIQDQAEVRSRKLGALIRNARLAARKTLSKCAHLTGVEVEVLRSWEDGLSAPSLPELEVLAYALNRPLHYFWSNKAKMTEAPLTESMNLPALIGIRQRMVGALLCQERKKAKLSLKTLSEQAGISRSRLKTYEMGETPIPLPELEGLLTLCGGQVEAFFDQKGPIGHWMTQQNAVQDFLQLSPELQHYISKPENRPYLELAKKLSNMSADKLRSLAEDLLKKISRYDN
jgi:transcriptional regulator with XRE-family HTH domain